MTVLVAVDATPEGAAAFDYAVGVRKLRGARLRVCSLAHGESYIERQALNNEELERMSRAARDQGIDVEVRTCVVPDIAEAIVDESSNPDVECLVLGIRRRSPVGELILGSVAYQVLLSAACPVFAVKSARG